MVSAEPGGLFALSVREGAEVVPRCAMFGDLEVYVEGGAFVVVWVVKVLRREHRIGTESNPLTRVFGT